MKHIGTILNSNNEYIKMREYSYPMNSTFLNVNILMTFSLSMFKWRMECFVNQNPEACLDYCKAVNENTYPADNIQSDEA
jgi:hypothetical protein